MKRYFYDKNTKGFYKQFVKKDLPADMFKSFIIDPGISVLKRKCLG